MKLRIATFNVENLDETKPGDDLTLEDRIPILRPQLERMDADIICFQEVHGQEEGDVRTLSALQTLMAGTQYANYSIATTLTSAGKPYDVRNLVVASRFPINNGDVKQYRNALTETMLYKKLTAVPPDEDAVEIRFQRPILIVKITVAPGIDVHLINVHLKSRRPTNIRGQQVTGKPWIWESISGWAEGYFLSSLKRVGQALETRMAVDEIFDGDINANIIVCGDFNAHPEEVPVEAILGQVENTGNPELVQRVLLSCEKTISEPARYTYIHQGQHRLLDHMLMSRNLLRFYRKAEIHNETLHDEGLAFAYDSKFPESDHAPFIVEFEMPDN